MIKVFFSQSQYFKNILKQKYERELVDHRLKIKLIPNFIVKSQLPLAKNPFFNIAIEKTEPLCASKVLIKL
jgi:hypothetical protein